VAEYDHQVKWIEVSFITNGELAEALADLLGRFVSNGVVVEKMTIFNPQTQENEPTGGVKVVGYLPANADLEINRHKLEEALWYLGRITPLPQPQYRPIVEKDWMAAWKQHYQPLTIGENILILPAWTTPVLGETRTVVRINPAMAFGTGTHPTTQLCLRLLERHLKGRTALIDIGCGSGILTIAALKMGASRALAVDIDSQAVASTQENARLNELPKESYEVGIGSVAEILTGRFSIIQAPLVLVNILAPIIVRLFSEGLEGLVSDSGTLLLSGILLNQEPDVLKAAQGAGFKLTQRLADEDWVGLALVKCLS